jgi:hypothetical protein
MGQELLAQICPPIGEIGLARPVLGFALVRNQLEGVTKSIALLEYLGNRVRRSLAARRIRNGLLLQKCAEQLGQLYLRVNAIRRSRSLFSQRGKLVN